MTVRKRTFDPTRRDEEIRSRLQQMLLGGHNPMGKLLVMIGRDWRTLLDEQMKPHGMSGARWSVLMTLMLLDEPTIQTTLARIIGVQGPTLVHMLDSLEKDGYVRRLPDPTDRRVKLVNLRPKGAKLAETLFEVAKSVEEDILGFLSNEEREGMHSGLTRIRSRIQELSDRG